MCYPHGTIISLDIVFSNPVLDIIDKNLLPTIVVHF